MSVAANRYARALIDALYPDNADAGGEQLRQLAAVFHSQPVARKLFENPTVPPERRKAFLDEIGNAMGFTPRVRNFIEILIDRKRLSLLEEIIKAYQKFLDEKRGVVRASVTAAQALTDAERAALTAKLETITGRQVQMEVSIDPALLGGAVARVGSTIYDGSLRQQLKAFKAKLVQE